MIVESHNGLADPRHVQATRVLITSDDGTPLVFILEFPTGNGQTRYQTCRAGDPDFEQQLKASGINRTVNVKVLTRENLR